MTVIESKHIQYPDIAIPETATYPKKTAMNNNPAHQSLNFGLSILNVCSKLGFSP